MSAIAFVIFSAAAAAAAPETPAIPWAPSLADALRIAKEKDGFAVAEFWNTWDSTCRTFEARILADPAVTAFLSGDVTPVRLNHDFNPGLAQKHDVRVVPTMLFFDARGEVCGRIVGYAEPADFLRQAREIIDAARRFRAAIEKLRDTPDDPEAMVDAGRGYHLRGDARKAKYHLQRVVEIEGARAAPWRALARLRLGEIAMDEKRIGPALREFDAAIAAAKEAKREDVEQKAVLQAALCHMQLSEFAQAAERAEAYLARFPKGDDRNQALFTAGFSRLRAGDDAAARAHLEAIERAEGAGIWAERAKELLKGLR